MKRFTLFYVGVLVLSAAWLFSIIIVPFLMESSSFERILAGWMMWFFAPICHQIPERSFSLLGHPLVVCARCTGIYAGFVLGTVLYPFVRKIGERNAPRFRLLAAAALPAALEWIVSHVGVMKSSNFFRGMTGLILGAAVVFWVYPAVFQMAGSGKQNRGDAWKSRSAN